ncbi:arginine--tRNA ligase, partial [Campylobacter jejuni]|nr:arginine--tRNA ligase [Campylobacter jejuni]
MKSIIFNEIKKILECDFALENPKDKNLAHFATPLAFSLAKELKKSPMLIASDLASKFQNHDCFELVEAVNGYLNFRISKTFLNELANQALTNPNDFTKGEKKQESFLLEYVSANPTGPLHIGHARGAVFGDTLTRLARHLGY